MKLAYLKTHKTGSSTLTNIFHRIAMTYNASVVLPKSNIFLGWPSKSRIDESCVTPCTPHKLGDHSTLCLSCMR